MIKFKSVFIHHISLLKIKSKRLHFYIFRLLGAYPLVSLHPAQSWKFGATGGYIFPKRNVSIRIRPLHFEAAGSKILWYWFFTSSEAKVGNSEPKEVICLRNKHEHWNLQTLVGHLKNGEVQQIFWHHLIIKNKNNILIFN